MKACPHCGNTDKDEFAVHSERRSVMRGKWFESKQVTCSCGAAGPHAGTVEGAWNAWDARAETPLQAKAGEMLELLHSIEDNDRIYELSIWQLDKIKQLIKEAEGE